MERDCAREVFSFVQSALPSVLTITCKQKMRSRDQSSTVFHLAEYFGPFIIPLFQDFDLVEDADDELKLDDDNFEAELEEMLQQNKEEA